MSETTVALFYDPWAGHAEAPVSLARPGLLWRKAVWFKANPRSRAYMAALLAEMRPAARLVDVGEGDGWRAAAAEARHILLLYPDAIGIGFGRIERALRRAAPAASLAALNGRRRLLPLDRATLRALRLRRFLERTMLVECVLGLTLLAATPLLLAFDYARGRR